MTTRTAAVAGHYYPAQADKLRLEINKLLDENPVASHSDSAPKALVVPHAGLHYSGALSARGFNLLKPWLKTCKRIFVLGPSHHHSLKDIAAPRADAFATPLGDLQLDAELIADWVEQGTLNYQDDAHVSEHSLEVQLPFICALNPDIKLVPLLVGDCPAFAVAQLVEQIQALPRTLLLVSSDLSHYHGYRDAQQLDKRTTRQIESLQPVLIEDQACGSYALNGLLQVAAQHGWQVETIAQQNTGDREATGAEVVGYGVYAFYADSA